MKQISKIFLLVFVAALSATALQSCGSSRSSSDSAPAESSETSELSSGESAESGTDRSQNIQEGTQNTAGGSSVADTGSAPGSDATVIVTDSNGQTRIEPALSTQSSANSPADSGTTVSSETGLYELTISVDSVKAKAGQERVPVSLRLSGDSIFSTGGLTIDYNPKNISPSIRPVTLENSDNLSYKTGSNIEDTMTYGTINEADGNHLFAFAFFNQNGYISPEGELMTFYVDIPADAKSGTVYPLDLEIDAVKYGRTKTLSVKTIDGSITIE
ncbi:MAG: hypothetical protein IKI58_07255 [Oscillospiraceae bacterium]|nr:hypothetical protein [Oscillospiraceae bacterium]